MIAGQILEEDAMKNEFPPMSRGATIFACLYLGVVIIFVVYFVAYASGYDICTHPTKGMYIASISRSDAFETWNDGIDFGEATVWIYRDLFSGEEKRIWVIEYSSHTDNTYDSIYELPAKPEIKDEVETWKKQFRLHSPKK